MHYMLDIETLGTQVNSAIIQIGMAAFTKEKVIRSNLWSIEPKGAIDMSTIQWWFGQIENGAPNPLKGKLVSLETALKDLASRMKEVETIWAHRATFDIPILTFAYQASGIPLPWTYKQIRDTITFGQLYPEVPRIEPESAHDAEHDAVAQASWMVGIWKVHLGR